MEVNWGNVESYSEVQSVNGLTGKVQLNIPTKVSQLQNDSGYVTATGDFATKEELKAVQSQIPSTAGLATKTELATVEGKIPDTTGLATKVELNNVAANIPETYLKVANLGDGSLTIINNKGESVVFKPPAAGGGGTTEKEWLIVTADIGTVETEEGVSYSTLENVSATKEDIKAAYAAGQNILLKLNDSQIQDGIVVCMPFSYTPINDSVDLLLLGTMLAGNDVKTYYIYYSMEDDMWSCNVFQMQYLDKAYGDSMYVDKEKTLPTLATKAELQAVENKIPDISGFATKQYVDNAIKGIKNANEVSY